MIHNKAQKLAEILKHTKGDIEEIETGIDVYFDAIKQTPPPKKEEETEQSMAVLVDVFDLKNPTGTSYTSKVCGILVENGFSPAYIVDAHIHFLKEIINKIQPLVQKCEVALKDKENEEELEMDIIDCIIDEHKEEFSEEIKALELLDEYYYGAIPAFAFDDETLIKAKKELSDIHKYTEYSIGFHWIAKLLTLLIDEPIIAIDLNTKKGIIGKMHSVSDNYQLQWLLMGLPELNDEIAITETQLDVVKGLSEEQSLEESIVGKWDMCNWQYVSLFGKEGDMHSKSEYWIWNEGIPADIPKFENYRVVLLDKPSYKRTSFVQRTFSSLESEIVVDKVLTEQEIEAFLEKLKSKKDERN